MARGRDQRPVRTRATVGNWRGSVCVLRMQNTVRRGRLSSADSGHIERVTLTTKCGNRNRARLRAGLMIASSSLSSLLPSTPVVKGPMGEIGTGREAHSRIIASSDGEMPATTDGAEQPAWSPSRTVISGCSVSCCQHVILRAQIQRTVSIREDPLIRRSGT